MSVGGIKARVLSRVRRGVNTPGLPGDLAWIAIVSRRAAEGKADLARQREDFRGFAKTLSEELADLKLREAKVRDAALRIEEQREDLDQREQDFLGDVIQSQAGMFRWSGAPRGLGAGLTYLADLLYHAAETAERLLHINLDERDECLEPGELALGMEASRQLNQAQELLRTLIDTAVKEQGSGLALG